MAVTIPDRSELSKCMICGEKVKLDTRICHSCYDSMRLGKAPKIPKRK